MKTAVETSPEGIYVSPEARHTQVCGKTNGRAANKWRKYVFQASKPKVEM
jgi:hypothetical protein